MVQHFGIGWVIRENAIIFLLFTDEKLKATEIKQYMEFLTVKNRTEDSDLPCVLQNHHHSLHFISVWFIPCVRHGA